MSRYWGLQITYVDVENNRFLTLGGAAFKSKRDRDASLATVPAAASDTDFILDVMSSRGIVDDRLITASTVEQLTRRSVCDLIAEAASQHSPAPGEQK